MSDYEVLLAMCATFFASVDKVFSLLWPCCSIVETFFPIRGDNILCEQLPSLCYYLPECHTYTFLASANNGRNAAEVPKQTGRTRP
jgi:hypothetical protein